MAINSIVVFLVLFLSAGASFASNGADGVPCNANDQFKTERKRAEKRARQITTAPSKKRYKKARALDSER